MPAREVIDMHDRSAIGFLPRNGIDPFADLLPLAGGFALRTGIGAGDDGVLHVAAIGAVDIVGSQAVIADAEAAAGEQWQGGRRVHRIATGFMLTWVEPTYSGWPSTNRNSRALSRTSARLSISSRL